MTEKPNFPVIDGHNDALMNYAPVGTHGIADFFGREADIQLDLTRSREGGLAAGLFAVFIPDEDNASMNMVHHFDPNVEYVLPALTPEYAARMTTAMVANLYRIEAASKDQ